MTQSPSAIRDLLQEYTVIEANELRN